MDVEYRTKLKSAKVKELSDIYAHRLARYCLIRYRCGEDHIVTATERHLIQMAKQKIQEEILTNYPKDQYTKIIEQVISHIKTKAVNRVWQFELESEEAEIMAIEISTYNLKDIFPVLN